MFVGRPKDGSLFVVPRCPISAVEISSNIYIRYSIVLLYINIISLTSIIHEHYNHYKWKDQQSQHIQRIAFFLRILYHQPTARWPRVVEAPSPNQKNTARGQSHSAAAESRTACPGAWPCCPATMEKKIYIYWKAAPQLGSSSGACTWFIYINHH